MEWILPLLWQNISFIVDVLFGWVLWLLFVTLTHWLCFPNVCLCVCFVCVCVCVFCVCLCVFCVCVFVCVCFVCVCVCVWVWSSNIEKPDDLSATCAVLPQQKKKIISQVQELRSVCLYFILLHRPCFRLLLARQTSKQLLWQFAQIHSWVAIHRQCAITLSGWTRFIENA